MIPLLVRYGLAVLLAVAVLGKARRFTAFRRSLAMPVAGALAILIVEALAAVLALSPAPHFLVGLVATGLGTAFTAVQTYQLAVGERSVCLCFGKAERVSWRTWARAALVLAAGLVLLLTQPLTVFDGL
ncbi:MauE/DoxX family redox-associated membrane protein [Streptosporangium sp. NPDC051023]|uniref:MauE/DoxX family redox-associated membrane protein n=1 Tax=Streptosporangium sp. NPDC051023 TaxID=3155410 RepID=UPI00345080EE